MNTPIQELIAEMESLPEGSSIQDCIHLAYAKLPTERQVIIDAHFHGFTDTVMDMISPDNKKLLHELKKDSEQYFKSTFEK